MLQHQPLSRQFFASDLSTLLLCMCPIFIYLSAVVFHLYLSNTVLVLNITTLLDDPDTKTDAILMPMQVVAFHNKRIPFDILFTERTSLWAAAIFANIFSMAATILMSFSIMYLALKEIPKYRKSRFFLWFVMITSSVGVFLHIYFARFGSLAQDIHKTFLYRLPEEDLFRNLTGGLLGGTGMVIAVSISSILFSLSVQQTTPEAVTLSSRRLNIIVSLTALSLFFNTLLTQVTFSWPTIFINENMVNEYSRMASAVTFYFATVQSIAIAAVYLPALLYIYLQARFESPAEGDRVASRFSLLEVSVKIAAPLIAAIIAEVAKIIPDILGK